MVTGSTMQAAAIGSTCPEGAKWVSLEACMQSVPDAARLHWEEEGVESLSDLDNLYSNEADAEACLGPHEWGVAAIRAWSRARGTATLSITKPERGQVLDRVVRLEANAAAGSILNAADADIGNLDYNRFG